MTPTEFFLLELHTSYEALQRSKVAQTWLAGNFRFDGRVLQTGEVVEFIDEERLTSQDLARLLMTFDGGRVHIQNQHDYGLDESPPGIYFTTIHPTIVYQGHKNRIGVVLVEGDVQGLVFEEGEGEIGNEVGAADRALHVDHHYLADDAPRWLGTIAFALCAMTAHNLGFVSISLIAGGGRGFHGDLIGYKYWPKLGFNAALLDEEAADAPHLSQCRTVQDVIALDPVWWDVHGSQRRMEFDLRAASPSWPKLLDYLREKELI